jgi:hypothetical protein
MKPHKRLMASLRAAEQPKRIPLEKWLETQPGSTRRGVESGKFLLPGHVYVPFSKKVKT